MEEMKKLVDQAKLSGQPEGAWVSALKIMTQKKERNARQQERHHEKFLAEQEDKKSTQKKNGWNTKKSHEENGRPQKIKRK